MYDERVRDLEEESQEEEYIELSEQKKIIYPPRSTSAATSRAADSTNQDMDEGAENINSVNFTRDAQTGNVTIVTQHYNYMHRGPELQFLSLHDYCIIIEVSAKPPPPKSARKKRKKKKKSSQHKKPRRGDNNDDDDDGDVDDDDNDDDGDDSDNDDTIPTSSPLIPTFPIGAGRKASRRYEFDEFHSGRATMEQKIRSKMPVPLVTGVFAKYPWNYIQGNVKHNTIAHKFAVQVLTLFKPWVGNRPSGEINWKGFCAFVRHLHTSNTLVNHATLQIIKNFAHGLQPNRKTKNIFDRW